MAGVYTLARWQDLSRLEPKNILESNSVLSNKVSSCWIHSRIRLTVALFRSNTLILLFLRTDPSQVMIPRAFINSLMDRDWKSASFAKDLYAPSVSIHVYQRLCVISAADLDEHVSVLVYDDAFSTSCSTQNRIPFIKQKKKSACKHLFNTKQTLFMDTFLAESVGPWCAHERQAEDTFRTAGVNFNLE